MDQKNNDNQRPGPMTGCSDRHRRVRIQARQRNHEDYRLPANLSHLPPMPLYLAVAHYALLACAPISRQVISAAFCISTRRALEAMRYLLNDKKEMKCERFPPLPEQRSQGYRIRVWAMRVPDGEYRTGDADVVLCPTASVAETLPTEQANKPRSRLEKEQARQEMRRWFLQRPNREC